MKLLCLFLLTSTLALTASCRSLSREPLSDLSASFREASIPDLEIKDIPFQFCPTKKSFSLVNALWLTYMASIQYSHFKVVGPELEALGFGDPGEGKAYFKGWYKLRLKRIQENKIDTDDTWKTEPERLARLELVRKDYRDAFNEDYNDDKVSALDFEKALTTPAPEAKIQFLTGVAPSKDNSFQKGSTQIFYAEHTSQDLSVISFRGSEFDESLDVYADVNLLYKKLDGMGNVLSGFHTAYMEVEPRILTILKVKSENKPINLWVTGHSLGGGLATLLVARIMQMHERGELLNVHLMGAYNMGSPRIGNLEFANTFDAMTVKQNITFVRIKNNADAVTSIPYGGYWHVGALAFAGADKVLYFGEGWRNIESKSQYLKTYLPSGAEHRVMPYWTVMKKAYMDHLGTELTDCTLLDPNVAPELFYEHEPDRKKTGLK